MPDVDGLTVLRQLRALPEAPVVAMLTTFDADEYILTALRSGAAGLPAQGHRARASRPVGADVGRGRGRPVAEGVPCRVDGHPGAAAEDAGAARVGQLTGRECEVLVLIAEGLSNADIGARVHLSAGTVKDHVSAILTKLRVGSRVQAALLAQRAGLLVDGVERPEAGR